MKREIVVEIICALFITLFMYAAVTKLFDYHKFVVQIAQSPLLTAFASWIAWVIPAVEILISVGLIIPRFRIIALYGGFTLMIMFTLYIIAILNFSMYIPCSCGGILEKLGWKEHLAFNIGFVLLAILGIALYHKKEDRKESIA